MSPLGWALAGASLGAGLGVAYLLRRALRMPVIPLPRAIQMVADDPGAATDAVFRAALTRTSLLFLRVVAPDGDDAALQPGDDLQVPTQVGPNGEAMLLTYCDLAAAKAVDPDSRFVAVTPRDALALVLKGGLDGLAVMNAQEAWGGVLAAHVPALLRRVQQVGVVSG